MSNAHEFALYYAALNAHESEFHTNSFVLRDTDLIHRMVRVLRMQVGQSCVLFNETMHVRAIIDHIGGKKEIILRVEKPCENEILKPHITVLLPLLKKDDFAATVYGLAELGVNDIQLIITDKVQRSWGTHKEMERIERILIAAAEQSKHFGMPRVHEPIRLQEALARFDAIDCAVFFHPTGMHATDLITQLHEKKPNKIAMLIGPEGDLTHEEQRMIQDAGFAKGALTPTILRAQHAAFLGAGLLRSVLHKTN